MCRTTGSAGVNPDLTQDLGQVYVDPDPRSYPLASYSYMITNPGVFAPSISSPVSLTVNPLLPF